MELHMLNCLSAQKNRSWSSGIISNCSVSNFCPQNARADSEFPDTEQE